MTAPNTDPAVLTVEEVAGILRCSRTSVYEAIKRGELQSFQVGRLARVTRVALAEFIGVSVEVVAS